MSSALPVKRPALVTLVALFPLGLALWYLGVVLWAGMLAAVEMLNQRDTRHGVS